MIPHRFPGVMYPAPPVRDFDTEEEDLKTEIAGHERLANSIWRILPCFVTDSAVQRMGLENIAHVLADFHRELRAYLCEGFEAQLEGLAEERKRPRQSFRPPKPSDEELVSAQMNVQRMEDAIAAIDNLGEKENYAFGAYVAMMRPILEGNLDQARQSLSWIQQRMEEPEDGAIPDSFPADHMILICRHAYEKTVTKAECRFHSFNPPRTFTRDDGSTGIANGSISCPECEHKRQVDYVETFWKDGGLHIADFHPERSQDSSMSNDAPSGEAKKPDEAE